MGSAADITFEIPQEDAARELCALLETARSYREPTDDGWSVHVVVGGDPQDLAVLLRRVEAWVAKRGLCAIRFRLDERWYVMESGEPIWAVEAA
jgi:hypothetical protein